MNTQQRKGKNVQPMPGQGQAQPPEITPTGRLQQDIEGDNVILYRSKRFFVRTVNNPNQRKHPLRVRGGNASFLGASFIDQIRWVSAEKQRVTEEPTRLLPGVDAINPFQVRAIPYPLLLEAIVVMVGLAIVVAAHAFNLFSYPMYGQNEGTLMANAWAVLHGQFEPTSYIYDLPPLGWIQIAAWLRLSGGLFAFGNAINSGRVFMLLLCAAGALLVCLIARRLSGSRSAGILALLIYALSPLSIVYQRQVSLENIGAFWLLLALYLVVTGNSRQRATLFAAVALGIAILTKLAFIVFLPVMLYVVWLHSTPFQRKFATVVFAYVTLAIVSAFVLLAALKGELLPTGFLPWDHHAHPSLVTELLAQVTQAASASNFSQNWAEWTRIDHLFILVGLVALAVNLIGGFWNRMQWLPALLALSFALFLLRGSGVYPYSIVPLLPLLALNIAIALNASARWFTKHVGFDLARAVLIFLLIGVLVPYNVQLANAAFTVHSTTAQNEALLWMRDNVPHNAVVITDSMLYTDLHEPGGEGVGNGTVYTNAYIYWNAAGDPQIYNGVLHENWNAIDYLVVDAQMLHDIQGQDRSMLLLNRTLHHAALIATFQTDTGDQGEAIQVYQVIHST